MPRVRGDGRGKVVRSVSGESWMSRGVEGEEGSMEEGGMVEGGERELAR